MMRDFLLGCQKPGLLFSRPLRNGFAARCEDAAMPFRDGYRYRIGLGPLARPSPKVKNLLAAGRSHRLTSGGKAVMESLSLINN